MMYQRYGIAILVSVALHAALVVFVVNGWNSAQENAPRIVPPKYINAKLVALEQKSVKKAAAKKKPKIVDLTAQKREKQKRLDAEKRKRQLDEQKRKAKEADKKRKLEQEKEKKQRQEALERKKKESEQKRKREVEQMENALLEEQGLLQDDIYETQVQSYVASIKARIEQNWSRPPSARTGMSCVLRIELVPNGRVINVNVLEGSGSASFDRSAIAAVRKAETFPEMKEVSIEIFDRQFRQFSLTFTPGDLRL